MEMLYRRCLAYGIPVLPHQQQHIDDTIERYRIPDEVLQKMDAASLTKYVEALTKCGFEGAYYWTQGQELLEELGFVRRDEKEGHRVFRSYEYQH